MRHRVLESSEGLWRQEEEEILEEVPFLVYINGRKLTSLFRTPGEDEALLIGLCFTEGIVREREDILSMRISEDMAEVRIKGEYKGGEEPRGVKEIVKEIKARSLLFKPEGRPIEVEEVLGCVRRMESAQRLREATGTSHAAMLFSYALEPISMGEDVGRHNAFDKAIGKALMEGRVKEVFLATLSSRISFEMAKKAAMIGAKILVGTSKATSMAVLLGEELKMSILSVKEAKEVMIYSSPKRIRR